MVIPTKHHYCHATKPLDNPQTEALSQFRGKRVWSTQPTEATRLCRQCRPRQPNQKEIVWFTADFLFAVTSVFRLYHCRLATELQLPRV